MKHIIGTIKTIALGSAFAMLPFVNQANEAINKKKKTCRRQLKMLPR